MNTYKSLPDELNNFYAHFEMTGQRADIITGEEETALTVMEQNVNRTLRRVNPRKAADPDGITGCVFKACANQLAPVLMVIFNLFLSQCIVPKCFKLSVIVPVPKKPLPSCLNDYHPIPLTSVVMKCFER